MTDQYKIVLQKREDAEIIKSLIAENVRLQGDEYVNRDGAKSARKTIETERARRELSGIPFDVGFACGLSYALGAFSGVCEKGDHIVDANKRKGGANEAHARDTQGEQRNDGSAHAVRADP